MEEKVNFAGGDIYHETTVTTGNVGANNKVIMLETMHNQLHFMQMELLI